MIAAALLLDLVAPVRQGPFDVLVACESSGRVRDAFRRQGFNAWSCDLLPTEADARWHYQCDIRKLLKRGGRCLIGFPDCTYVCGSGLHWNDRGRGWERTEAAVEFFRMLLDAPFDHIALENPVGLLSSRIRKPDQIIQPHQFGEDASKATCLWLKNLPLLQHTRNVVPRVVNGRKRWANQTDSGQNRLAPSPNRWREREAGPTKGLRTPWQINGGSSCERRVHE